MILVVQTVLVVSGKKWKTAVGKWEWELSLTMRMGWEWERSHGNGGKWELKNHYLCSNRHTSNLGVCVCVNDWQWIRGSFCGLWLAICLRVTSSPVWRSASSTVPSTSDIPPNLSIRQNRTFLLSLFIYFIIHIRNKGPWPLTGCIQCTIIRQYKRVTLKGYWQCPHCNGRVSSVCPSICAVGRPQQRCAAGLLLSALQARRIHRQLQAPALSSECG